MGKSTYRVVYRAVVTESIAEGLREVCFEATFHDNHLLSATGLDAATGLNILRDGIKCRVESYYPGFDYTVSSPDIDSQMTEYFNPVDGRVLARIVVHYSFEGE